jgi:16S rRNA (guanine527-N7)-methyltransferase
VGRRFSIYEDRLGRYEALVRSYAPRLDLVSPEDLARFRSRHIDDSLRLLPLLDQLPAGPCVDVGSGAGLPGVPLAIARPDRPWRLIEPRKLRAAFLEEVVRELQLTAEVVVGTAERCAADPRLAEAHVLATARALAPPEATLVLLRPLIVPGGVVAIFIGSGAQVPPEAEEWEEGLAIVRT